MQRQNEMNKPRKRVQWTGIGLTLALLAGSPAWADDTELLLSTPNSTGADKPNILFILDSSGSMTTIEKTQAPYDRNGKYSGSCSRNRYYWTEGNSIPECRSDGRYSVEKTSFYCAQGVAQMSEAGSYYDTFAQYRRTNRSGFRWRPIRDRDDESPVECAGDSGKHGAGYDGDDEDAVYARIGTESRYVYQQQETGSQLGQQPNAPGIHILRRQLPELVSQLSCYRDVT